MSGKIFINYRRDDSKADARGLHDRLSRTFGKTKVFMDVDNLLAGQRFDQELEKALDSCDVFLAVIGPQWLEILNARHEQDERDYVHEEIAAALKRKIIVIPVLVDGAVLPTKAALPEDLHELVLYQKHEISHEKFGRDVEELISAIKTVMKQKSPPRNIPVKKIAAILMTLGLIGASIYAYPLISSTIKTTLNNSAKIATQKATLVEQQAKETQRIAEEQRQKQKEQERLIAEQAKVKRKAQEEEEERAKQKKLAAEKEKAEKEAKEKSPRGDAQLQPHIKEDTRLYKPGDTFKDCDDCPEMVVVPPGEFMMGSPKSEKGRSINEGPRHKVTISNKFAVGQFEITRAQFTTFVNETGHDVGNKCTQNNELFAVPEEGSFKNPGFKQNELHPVVCVNWNDAQTYVKWLTNKTGKIYRLLSEAEWEYAARSKTTTPFWFGKLITRNDANYSGVYYYDGSKGVFRNETATVKSFSSNFFGLYNVHGNVFEWVEDCWHDNYHDAPKDGTAWKKGRDCSKRVIRGGSFYSFNDDGDTSRSAHRSWAKTNVRIHDIGFRVSRTLVE